MLVLKWENNTALHVPWTQGWMTRVEESVSERERWVAPGGTHASCGKHCWLSSFSFCELLGNPQNSRSCSIQDLLLIYCECALSCPDVTAQMLQGKSSKQSPQYPTRLACGPSSHSTWDTETRLCVSLLFPQSIANLMERRQFETKENKWVALSAGSFTFFKVQDLKGNFLTEMETKRQ